MTNHLYYGDNLQVLRECIATESVETQEKIQFEMTVKFPHPVTAFALVIGGWFPLPLVGGHVLVLDRNVLAMLQLIHSGTNARSDIDANAWWFSFINANSQMVNPVLCAFEGSQRRVPTFGEFQAEFLKLGEDLKVYLPQAKQVTYMPQDFEAVYEILNNLSDRYQAETDFLVKAAPLVAQPNADAQLNIVRDQILGLACTAGLKRRTLVVLAILSCLYESKDGSVPSIARRLIKPNPGFSAESAHNAIWDLRALEFLAGASALGQEPVAVCTRDRAMGAFWCALSVKDPVWEGNSLTYNITLNQKLFPRLSDQGIEELGTLVFA